MFVCRQHLLATHFYIHSNKISLLWIRKYLFLFPTELVPNQINGSLFVYMKRQTTSQLLENLHKHLTEVYRILRYAEQPVMEKTKLSRRQHVKYATRMQ